MEQMQTVLFTKAFVGRSIEEIGASASELGFDGIDLLIRPGHQVEPTAPDDIPRAVKTLAGIGLSVPMATTDLTDPAQLPGERLLASCAEAGIGLIRLGYWHYDPTVGHAAGMDRARRDLDALASVARATGVRLAVQLHGGTMHASGADTAALLAGHDPAIIGAYADPGNQAVQNGREDWQLTFDVLAPWLCCVGVKNGGWFPADVAASGQRRWRSDWLGLADGMVPWDDIIGHLVESRFDGLLSFHSHYEGPLGQVLDRTRLDLHYVEEQLGRDRRGEVR
jgi:sugar phosphate isomerase/epimerase